MDTALRPVVPPLPAVVRLPEGQVDVAQEFVDRLRAASPRFAAAAGAHSAVVREVVPPARHRRARCRMVLRSRDGAEVDLTFLGPVSRTPAPDRTFEAQVARWLRAEYAAPGRGVPQIAGSRIAGSQDGSAQDGSAQDAGAQDEGAWLVADDEASGGRAVDLTAWAASTGPYAG